MELKIHQTLLKSRPGYIAVVAYAGPYVERMVEPFRDVLSGKTIYKINVREFEFYEPVRLPSSVSDYPRYRATVLAASRRCKARVNSQYFKKYPLAAC